MIGREGPYKFRWIGSYLLLLVGGRAARGSLKYRKNCVPFHQTNDVQSTSTHVIYCRLDKFDLRSRAWNADPKKFNHVNHTHI